MKKLLVTLLLICMILPVYAGGLKKRETAIVGSWKISLVTDKGLGIINRGDCEICVQIQNSYEGRLLTFFENGKVELTGGNETISGKWEIELGTDYIAGSRMAHGNAQYEAYYSLSINFPASKDLSMKGSFYFKKKNTIFHCTERYKRGDFTAIFERVATD